MGRITSIFTTAAVAAAVGAFGLIGPAAAQQDYSTTPGYGAHPQGMCWHRSFGAGGENDIGGYWGACKNSNSASQPANQARAQASQQRNGPNGYRYAPRR